MTTWLPRRRTSRNPCCASNVQSSLPEKTRRLPSADLESGDEDLAVHSHQHFRWIGRFEEELYGFSKVRRRVFDRVALAGDFELRTEGDVTIVFAVDHCGKASSDRHGSLFSVGDELRAVSLPERVGVRPLLLVDRA